MAFVHRVINRMRYMSLRGISLATMICFVMMFCMSTAHANSDMSSAFEKYLSAHMQDMDAPQKVKKAVRDIYARHHYNALWLMAFDTPRTDLHDYNDAIIGHAHFNGMKEQPYDAAIYFTKVDTQEGRFNAELFITVTYLNYLHDIQYGAVRVQKYDSLFFTPDEGEDLAAQLEEFINTADRPKFLETLVPQDPSYGVLRKALVSLQLSGKDSQISHIDYKREGYLYIGDKDSAVPQIRARLRALDSQYDGKLTDDNWLDSGRLKLSNPHHKYGIGKKDVFFQKASFSAHTGTSKTAQDDTLYDAELARQVAQFQYFNGLKTDAVIGPSTIYALNQSKEEKINKIRASLERIRWLPKDLGDKHVLINIPAFYASAVRHGKEAFKMPVIVGQDKYPTPLFSSVISNVKMQPDWTSPDSITKRYLLPKITRNPDVVYALGYELQNKRTGEIIPWDTVDYDRLIDLNIRNYQIRQKPGRHNALGLARISIENPHAIFMHGTPNQGLFDRASRSFSSGCVRLQDPLKMAKFVLQDEVNYDEAKIERLYNAKGKVFGKSTFLNIRHKIPVHLTYLTAWADGNANTHFAPDIYGRDKKLLTEETF